MDGPCHKRTILAFLCITYGQYIDAAAAAADDDNNNDSIDKIFT